MDSSLEFELSAPPSEAIELISRREFARRKGWAASHVVGLVKKGAISAWLPCPLCQRRCRTCDEACACGQAIASTVDHRRGKIDPVSAERELIANRDPARDYVAERWRGERGGTEVPARGGELLEGASGSSSTFAGAKATHQHYQAQMARLEYERRVGQVGDLSVIHADAFKIARQMRDAMLGIPTRLAPLLAGERSETQCQVLLATEITRVLDEMSRSIAVTWPAPIDGQDG